jgi:Tol biopolymer transport system component
MSPDQQHLFTVEDALAVKDFNYSSPIRFSRDGKWLAYVLDDHTGDQPRAQLWLTEVATGRSRQILAEAHNAWGLAWSSTELLLVFYADTGAGLQLWVWNAQTEQPKRLSEAIVASAGWLYYEVPRWLPNGRAVICKLVNADGVTAQPACDIPKNAEMGIMVGKQPTVRIWESGSEDANQAIPPIAGIKPGTLSHIDIATGKITALVDVQSNSWVVSPDNELVAFAELVEDSPTGWTFDVRIMSCQGGEASAVFQGLHTPGDNAPALSWSPDGALLAFRMGGYVGIAPVNGGATRILLGSAQEAFDRQFLMPRSGARMAAS